MARAAIPVDALALDAGTLITAATDVNESDDCSIAAAGNTQKLLILAQNPTGPAAEAEIQTFTPSAGAENDTFKFTMLGDEGDALTIPSGGFASITLAQVKAAADSCVGIVEGTNLIITGSTGGPFAMEAADDLDATDLAAFTMTSKTGAANGAFVETNKGVVDPVNISFTVKAGDAVAFANALGDLEVDLVDVRKVGLVVESSRFLQDDGKIYVDVEDNLAIQAIRLP